MLSRELGYSPKHLISLFRDQVGIPPKLLARLVRFERVMGRLRPSTATKDVCLADLAAIHGYSDQAHLARDVKHFTGLTASEARQSLSDELVDLFG
jgi:AraC-like DNA-binding protein